MFRKGDITDLMQFDARVPQKVNWDRWLPSVINEFGNYAEESCMVVNRLLEDRLIRMIPKYGRAGQNTRPRTYQEPQSKITLSELLNGESFNIVWDAEFIQAVATQNQQNQEGAPFKLL